MKIQFRFILLLGSILGGFGIVIFGLYELKLQQESDYRQAFKTEQSAQLNHWLNTDAKSWLQITAAHAEDASVLDVLEGRQATLPLLNRDLALHPTMPEVWVLRRDGTVAAEPERALASRQPNLFTNPDFSLTTLHQDQGWFYFGTAEGLAQAYFATVMSPDIKSPIGWVVLVRDWNRSQLEYLGALAGGKLSLRQNVADHAPPEGNFQLTSDLLDWRGQYLRTLVFDLSPGSLLQADSPTAPTLLMVSFGLLLILALGLSLQRWVLRPLHWIQQSLVSGELAPIAPLRARQDELGGVANLLAASFEQRKALHESETNLRLALEERIRLGRDLHDGVIQSLYATGMGLACIKSHLHRDQEEVTAKLEQSRAALNETITDLRNFITGLEPEALKRQTFTEAVAKLLEFARDMRSIETTCTINEELAACLSIHQRANILQFTREAVSNALRHGEATAIAITFQANGAKAEYEIRDNGRGFNFKRGSNSGGLGLENLTHRARDMGAEIIVNTHPGSGTQLKLVFPLPADPTP
ncbi:MAG: sensor histidine kinase [Cephaloticoccus sp.]|nr:sensor histidine kinase [Cephaloticoccus sp.]MCF7761261.1 sensor histidine kinase [Cephaloticoccus sp.]